MDMYCEKCRHVGESDQCFHCKSWAVRPAEPGDLCFLTEQGYVQASILGDILKQNGIPFVTRNRHLKGAAIIMMSNRLFYVAYEQLEAARAVVEELFYAPEEGAEEEPAAEPRRDDPGLEFFTPDEIDDLDAFEPHKMNREELDRFKRKLSATLKEMKLQERQARERIDLLRDMIDETDYIFEELSE